MFKQRLIVFASCFTLLAGLYGVMPLYQDSLSSLLIERAWQASLRSGEPGKAWFWMESYPVAKIHFTGEAPMIVMSGSEPSVLAHAPVWHEGTARPGEKGISLITGDHQLHFSFLKTLSPGDSFNVLGLDGHSSEYRFEEVRMVEQPDMQFKNAEEQSVLVLSTTYPVKNWQESGDLQMIAVARAVPPRDSLHFAALAGR